ncbi:hypothetical protein ACTQYZ_08440 [Anaerofustis sp. LCP19S3_F7]|uniref:hypothetical protein n=1 Tax=Anaerofustis sp. LCP19S3_F7 TaxID=3440247 RepID=UPI003F92EB27
MLDAYKSFDIETLDNIIYLDYSIQEGLDNIDDMYVKVFERSTKNLEYEILDVNESGDSVTVKVKITNENIGDVLVDATIKGSKDQVDKNLSDAETYDYIEKYFFESLESFEPDIFSEEVEFSLVKVDGECKVNPLDNDQLNPIMGNYFKSISDMTEEYGIY